MNVTSSKSQVEYQLLQAKEVTVNDYLDKKDVHLKFFSITSGEVHKNFKIIWRSEDSLSQEFDDVLNQIKKEFQINPRRKIELRIGDKPISDIETLFEEETDISHPIQVIEQLPLYARARHLDWATRVSFRYYVSKSDLCSFWATADVEFDALTSRVKKGFIVLPNHALHFLTDRGHALDVDTVLKIASLHFMWVDSTSENTANSATNACLKSISIRSHHNGLEIMFPLSDRNVDFNTLINEIKQKFEIDADCSVKLYSEGHSGDKEITDVNKFWYHHDRDSYISFVVHEPHQNEG